VYVAIRVDAKEDTGPGRRAAPEYRGEVDRASVQGTAGVRLDVVDGVDRFAAQLRQYRLQPTRLDIETHDAAAAGADHRAIGIEHDAADPLAIGNEMPDFAVGGASIEPAGEQVGKIDRTRVVDARGFDKLVSRRQHFVARGVDRLRAAHAVDPARTPARRRTVQRRCRRANLRLVRGRSRHSRHSPGATGSAHGALAWFSGSA
jgi:hypothetical protein